MRRRRSSRPARRAAARSDRARARHQAYPAPHRVGGLSQKLAARGEDWDLALVVWTPNIPEPHAYLNQLLENQFLDGRTLTGFRSRIASRELRRAARTLQAQGRAQAYADLDAFLARNEAPLAALNVISEITLVSDRMGCIVLRPVLDLAVACLKS